MLYDIFICHAFEDKKSFVRPLAKSLRENNVEVWYDEFTLKFGDSIRRSLDKGLRNSRFGVVVLSKAFFEKEWPQYELDGLTEREIKGKEKIILPIWHGITHDDLMKYSPSLAAKKAISTDEGMAQVVKSILEVTHPQESPLIAARDLLIEWGLNPPVITDQHWLEIVEASNRIPSIGAVVPDQASWGRWYFPLPSKSGGGKKWGERLAWTAMQMSWEKSAEEIPITPLTHPKEVLDFIHDHPGLYETCITFPSLLAEYAPQLTIRGFGGDLEDAIEEEYKKSCKEKSKDRANNSKSGSGLTTNKKCPLCEEEWAFRHPTFCDYESTTLASSYFSGGIFGPPVSPYEHADHIFWLLSRDSSWLPKRLKTILIDGMKNWTVWLWWSHSVTSDSSWETCGALAEALFAAKSREKFKRTEKVEDDLINRVSQTIRALNLSDKPSAILKRFFEQHFPEYYIDSERRRRKRQKG